MTATTWSAPNVPAVMHAAIPEASITLFNSTLATTIAGIAGLPAAGNDDCLASRRLSLLSFAKIFCCGQC